MEERNPEEAGSTRRDLEHAHRLAEMSRARGWRWVRTYLTGWAAGSVVLVMLVGLASTTGLIIGMVGWALLVATGVTWSRRQGIIVSAAGRRLNVAATLWAAAYGVVLAVGLPSAPGDPAFWIPAAVFTTLPLLLAAYLPERRRDTVAATESPR